MSREAIKRWANTQIWKDEIEKLDKLEQEAAVELAHEYKDEYKSQLLKSRDIIRQTADSQVQQAGNLTVAAARATKVIMQNPDPVEAVRELVQGGTCQLTLASSQASRAAKDLLNEVYAVNRVLEFLDAHNP